MISILDALVESKISFESWLERSSEHLRERKQYDRLAIWKQMQFEERMKHIYVDFQNAIPDAELTYVGKGKAIITGTNPIDGKTFEYVFLP